MDIKTADIEKYNWLSTVNTSQRILAHHSSSHKMLGQIPHNQILSAYFLTTPIQLTFFSKSALAHNVKTSFDVGVTFHIEPDHSPQTGQESQAWFALTRKGGELIPLSQCECELNVYLESSNDSPKEPLLNTQLVSLSPEKYQNIPGANLIFPKPGIYQLELTGKPKTTGDFTPFQVRYPVTVKAGKSKQNQPANISSESKQISGEATNSEAPSSDNQSISQQEIKPNLSIIIPLLIGILAISISLIKIWKLFTDNQEDN